MSRSGPPLFHETAPRSSRARAAACRSALASAAGFTLLELLVVTAVIVILLGGTAIALSGRGGEGAALQSAQSLVAGLVGSTRAQAALHQTNARLLVYGQQPPGATADATKYLRMLQVVRQETLANGTTVWVAAGDPVTLPLPVCVVPPAPVPTNHLGLPAGQSWNNNVATGPTSTLTALNGFNYRGQSVATVNQYFGTQGQTGRVLYLEMDQTGAVVSPSSSGNPIKIALSTATLNTNAPPQFNNATRVRGIFIRRNGAVSMVDESTGF